jgi:hypothetical protein
LRLDIGTGDRDVPDSYLQRAFDSIIQPNQPKPIFNALRELRIELTCFENTPKAAIQFIHKASQFCGSSLEVWLGNMPMTVDGLAETFSKFEKLKVVHLNRETIGEYNPEEYVLTLAEKCLKLEEIVVTNYGFPRKDTLATIVRDGLVPRLYRLEEL